jgi:hypothetical protein
MTEPTRIQRHRLAALMWQERYDAALSAAEREELAALQQLGGIRPDAPMKLVKEWADAGPDSMRRSMTPRQRQVETLGMRWPKPRLSGRQAQLELLRLKAEWQLTPRQRQVARMKRP